MERCMLIKLLVTAGAGAAAGVGGFYAKQMTGAVIGAGVGGVLGWLLAPGCDGAAASQSSVSKLSAARIADVSKFAPVAPVPEVTTPKCGANQYYDEMYGMCMDMVK